MMGAFQPSLFQGSPTWDDVQKGRARLVRRIEPCDKCEGSPMSFWNDGRCTHTEEHYAFPKKRPGGMCSKAYLEWA
jgi:hypothetical protein